MTSDIELAAQRIRQLVDLTKALTARLAEETRAFEAQRPQDAAASLPKTQELANLYRRDSAHVKANPALIASAPAADKAALLKATEAFETVLARHSRAVDAARRISEGLMQAIAQEVAAARTPASAYGAGGQANAGDGRAFALNRTA
ncbi:flagellar basal-body protein FlbY [uncultured Brevundimonas sp.]|uniref:flagellar basal-body protein FlbY n=1 Tax=uncultured Brevundimonas sp. TaxID=213418 RepID=UPI0025F58DFC|nr:flagellar basal-body protein FlbY [uncultured Brevundimonas sp.]